MTIDNLVTGRTRVIFMLGSPVAQTRAPDLFNRYFRDKGLDRVVAPLEIRPERVASFLDIVRSARNCDGVIVTVPLKQAVFAAVDQASERARELGTVNVVRREADGALAGDMTDGPGFWDAAGAHGFDPVGRRIALAGAGAAAAAIAHEFLRRGGREVSVQTRERGEFDRLVGVLGPRRCALASSFADLTGFDMAINATPVGMAHAPGTPFHKDLLASLPAQALVADAVTDPKETQLLADARALGLGTMAGEDMTLGQFRMLGEFLGVL